MEEKRGRDVRVEDIARAAGVSRQAVYLHFGSRAGLLIATTHYVDRVMGAEDRLKSVVAAQNGAETLDAYVEFWGNYIPMIYGLAKALLQARDTDEAAAAAWNDRMEALRQGCCLAIQRLDVDGMLAPGWTAKEAEDMLWSLLAIQVWEDLVLECGWPQEQYVVWMKVVLRGAFVGENRNEK
jgi:AcrR family transcriptional regulator